MKKYKVYGGNIVIIRELAGSFGFFAIFSAIVQTEFFVRA